MARFNEQSKVPNLPDQEGVRHFGDGIAGPIVASRLQGFDTSTLSYVDVAVDANGTVQTAGGAAGGGGAVTVADGADVAQGTTTDAASASTVVGLLKAIKAAVQGVLNVDVSDRVGRLLGHVTIDNATLTVDTELPAAAALADTAANPTAPAVGAYGLLWNGASWDRAPGDKTNGLKVQSAQLPAALVGGRLSVDASGVAVPVTDNAGSLTVDAPVGTPVFARLSDGAAVLIGQKTAALSLPVVPASDWLTEPVPTGGFGNPSLRVFVNSVRKATYYATAVNLSTGALVAATAKAVLSFEHALASTKNARIRRIYVTGIVSTAGAAALTFTSIRITKGVAATSAGTVVTPGKSNEAQGAADTVIKSLPTIVAATVWGDVPILVSPAAGAAAGALIPRTLVYDWSEAGSVEPLILRAGTLESIVINALSTSTPTLALAVEIEFTEE